MPPVAETSQPHREVVRDRYLGGGQRPRVLHLDRVGEVVAGRHGIWAIRLGEREIGIPGRGSRSARDDGTDHYQRQGCSCNRKGSRHTPR